MGNNPTYEELENQIVELKKQNEIFRMHSLSHKDKEKSEDIENYTLNILNNISDPVFVKDDQSRLLLVNDSFCEIFDLVRDKIIGKTLAEDVPDEERESFLKIDKQVLSDGIENINEESLTVRGGQARIISTKKSRFIDSNGDKFLIGIIRDISDRKQAEIALQESEDKLSKTLIAANDGTWDWNLITNKVYFDPRYYEIAGYVADEFPHEFEEFQKRIHPDDVENIMDQVQQHLEGKTARFDVEFRFKKKSGDWIWLMGRGLIVERDKNNKPLRFIGTHTDIAERKKVEKALKKSEYILNETQQISKIGGWDYDVESRETYFSDEVFNIYGLPNDKMIKADEGIKFYHPDDIQLVSDSFEKAITQGIPYDIEVRFTNAQGKNMWVRTVGKPIYKNEKVVQILGNIMDITERKAIDKTLQEHAQELQKRNEDLDAFSHTVAHDLKNPLANILGFADLLSEDYNNIPEDQAKLFINAIVKSGKKTQEIINSLLLLASVRKAEIKTTKINMGGIVKKTLERLSPMILKNSAKVTFSKTWPTAIAYSPWVEEVLINYLSNAIKYGGTPPVIEIGYDTVKTKDASKKRVRFWVKDDGSGISAKNQTLLFRKFERLDQVKTEGYGLGLSIVERIIEKLEGDVGLESVLGKGSKFYFTLPLAEEK